MMTEDIEPWKKHAIVIGHVAAILWFWFIIINSFNAFVGINSESLFFGEIFALSFSFISILIIYRSIKNIYLNKRLFYYNVVIVVSASIVIFATYVYKEAYSSAVHAMIFTIISIVPTMFTKILLSTNEQIEPNINKHSLEKWELYALLAGHFILLFLSIIVIISLVNALVTQNTGNMILFSRNIVFLLFVPFSITTSIIVYQIIIYNKLSKKCSYTNIILFSVFSLILFNNAFSVSGDVRVALFWSLIWLWPSVPSLINILIIRKYGEILIKKGSTHRYEPTNDVQRIDPEVKQTAVSKVELKPAIINEPQGNGVDAKTAFGYKGATIIYKVKIENNTSEPISDIKVYPYVPDVFLLIEKEKSISLIEPKSSQTVTFEIRPTGECGDCNVSGRVNYYDMASKKRQDIELEPKSLSVVCPMLHRKEISEDAWRDLVSNLVKAEETTADIPIEGEGLFGMISEILKDLNLFALAPSITKAHQIFRGTAKFYGEGIKGLRYAANIEVVGGAKKSKLILKTWAEREDALTGFYHGVLDEIEKRVKVKEYIDDGIVRQYNIHIGDEIGTQVKDSFVQRSNLGP